MYTGGFEECRESAKAFIHTALEIAGAFAGAVAVAGLALLAHRGWIVAVEAGLLGAVVGAIAGWWVARWLCYVEEP